MRLYADAVLFDNDGVLVDSHDMVEAAWRTLAREYDLPIDALLGELAGVRAIDTLARHLEGSQAAAAAARLEDIEVSLANQTRVKPGARAVVGRLPKGSWAVVTSASRRLATARWRGANLAIPDVMVTAENVGKGKPHPEPFLVAADRLGVTPNRCVVFEDSASGGLAAQAAGITPVAVGDEPWPFAPVARIQDLTSVTVVVLPSHRGLQLMVGDEMGR